MISINIFKTVGKSSNIFELGQGNKPCSIFNITCMCMCVEECVLFVMYWYKQIQYELTNTDLRIMYPQCSNLNLSHGFCDVGQ